MHFKTYQQQGIIDRLIDALVVNILILYL